MARLITIMDRAKMGIPTTRKHPPSHHIDLDRRVLQGEPLRATRGHVGGMAAIRHLALCLILRAAVASAISQSVEEFPIRQSAASAKVQGPEEILYRSNNLDDHGFNRIVKGVTVPTLTVYLPAPSRHRRAGLVVCPGGGYEQLAIDSEGYALGRYFQKQGLAVAVLKYRLPQPAITKEALPLSQDDALTAIQFVRRRAAKWGVDEHRIGILGFSAGGHPRWQHGDNW